MRAELTLKVAGCIKNEYILTISDKVDSEELHPDARRAIENDMLRDLFNKAEEKAIFDLYAQIPRRGETNE